MQRSFYVMFLSLAVSVGVAEDSAAQAIIRVSGDPCTGCRVERQLLFSVSDLDQPMVKWHLTMLARDSRGRWLLSTMERATGIAVYDSSGRFLHHFGRRGEGPGEHQSLRALAVGPGDSIHVFDVVLRRYSVFSPTFQFVRSATTPGAVSGALVLPDGLPVVNADFPTPAWVGYPLHQLNPDGSVRRSYGSEVPGYRVDADHLLTRNITWAGSNRVWSIPALRYEPELWAPTGKLAEIHRTPNWFTPVRTTHPPGLRQPPSPWVAGAWLDDRNRLWVMFRVPDANWKPQPAARDWHVGGSRPIIKWNEEYDAIIEVLDLGTGKLLASTRFDEGFGQLIPGGYVSSYREDPEGNLLLDVWRLQLINP